MLLTGQHNPFRVPVDPGTVAIYIRPVVTGQSVEQATIDTQLLPVPTKHRTCMLHRT